MIRVKKERHNNKKTTQTQNKAENSLLSNKIKIILNEKNG